MRYALILIFLMHVGALSAAVEVFTLHDGRTFTGEYDEEEQRLYTSIGGKATSILVSKDEIAERLTEAQAKAKKVAAPQAKLVPPSKAGDEAEAEAAPIEAPKPMTPEEKKAADAAYALALIRRGSEKLIAEAAKAERDAKEARSDAERKRKEAKGHRKKFVARAKLEDVTLWDHNDDLLTTLYILPRTSGNNQATVDAWARAGQLDAQAAELDATAARKRAEAAMTAGGR